MNHETRQATSQIYEQLRDYMNWGFGITAALSFGLLSREELAQLYQTNPIVAAASTCLLIVTSARFFIYLHACRNEIELLYRAFGGGELSRLRGPVFSITIGLSILFAGLIAYCTNILVYSVIVVIFTAFDLYGPSTVNRNIGLLILNRKPTEKLEGETRILFNYYLAKPLFLRLSLLLISYCGALIAAIAWYYTNETTYQYAAYLICISVTLIGELVLYRWRKERDTELDSLEKSKRRPEQSRLE